MPKKKQVKKLNSLFIRLGIAIVVLVFIFVVFIGGPRGSLKLYQSYEEKQELLKKIDELRAKKARLDSERVRLLNDPAYIEKIARETYNMKRKGEKVYKIKSETEK